MSIKDRVIVVALSMAFALVGSIAHARDTSGRYAASPLHEWFSGLHSRGGAWCCDEADGTPTDNWGVEKDSYYAVIDGHRVMVPPDALVDGPNKLGRAIVWFWHQDGKAQVRCFMPGTMG